MSKDNLRESSKPMQAHDKENQSENTVLSSY